MSKEMQRFLRIEVIVTRIAIALIIAAILLITR